MATGKLSAITFPWSIKSASGGNGTHIAFNANTKGAVNAFHAAALSAGGKDEGAPGPSPEYTANYYGAFVRDLDGNKIEAVFLPMQTAAPAAKAKARKAKPAKKAAARKAPARRTAKAKKRARKGARRR